VGSFPNEEHDQTEPKVLYKFMEIFTVFPFPLFYVLSRGSVSDQPAEASREMNMNASVICRVVAIASIAALSLTTVIRPARAETTEVTLTGSVSCARCQGFLLPKGWTEYRWGIYSVNHGDDVVLVVEHKYYTLKGDRDRLLKFMYAGKTTVTGRLDGSTLEVETIGRAVTNK